MKAVEKEFLLDPAGVDAVSEVVDEWLKSLKMERRDAIRLRLTMEELLLRVSEHFDGAITGALRMGKRFGVPYLRFRYKSDAYNPLSVHDEMNEWTNQILTNMGLSPTWGYHGGHNELTLRACVSSHKSELMMLAALVAALALGLSGALLPETVVQSLSVYVVGPLSEIFLRLLNTFAGPMIFLAVVTGICGSGSMADFGKMGRLMLVRFLGLSFVGSAAAVLLARPFFALVKGGNSEGGTSQSEALLNMVLDILPSNPVRPFYDGNTLQIIFLAVLIGVILLMLGEYSTRFRQFLSDFNAVIMQAVELVCKLLPIYIFSSLTLQFWESGAAMLFQIWKPIVVCVILCAVFLAAKALIVGAKLKVNPVALLRVNLPAMLVGYATASSMSAFNISTEICEKKLGIPSELTQTGIPIGGTLYVSTYSMIFILIAYYATETYGTAVNMVWFILVFILGTILACAAPPVSGGTLACIGIMLTQLNIPPDALAVSATLSVLLDFICTGTKIGFLHMELALQADKLGCLKRKSLDANTAAHPAR